MELVALEDSLTTGCTWLEEVFHTGEVDDSGNLTDLEVVKLMKKLNTGLTTVKIQQKLKMTKVTKDKCLEIMDKFEPSKEGRKLGQLGIDGFTAYLLSDECDAFDKEDDCVCEDMTQPLSHYFIASSHNTYLLEDQLRGPSSVEGYIRALQRGCRCIDLDCWDGPNDQPIIYHGRTLTSKISFKSVIEAINEHAFVTSDYPVILSLESHCSLKQQQAMTHYMKTILKDKLHLVEAEENKTFLPSPETLRKKIIVKGKKLALGVKELEGYVTEEDESADMERSRRNAKRTGEPKKYKLSRDLSDIVSYCRSVRFKDFQSSQQRQRYYEMCSLSESSALKLANASPEEFVNHNKRFLSRIYPNSMRVDSSNYNPQDLWNCGCQLVALNYQTSGLMMDLNDGRFLQNGGCGYVLKPAVMRDEMAYFSANTRDLIPGVSPLILHIKVISGQRFPKPKGSGAKGDTIDPYVTVEIFGIPADCAEERTKTVQHNGYNPLFDESFEFQVNLPELALVRFAVLDDDYIGDEFISQYTIPFECLQTGYRHIRLKSNTGDVIPNCTLFVHIAVTNKRGGGVSANISY
ncbi:hypothetical protein NP493_138g02010 [Ridgeia piscesae]|uniref:Phosphoinositide phospholipase C n=1 Tax=Ridgeia piscesae TaxID=27915 RepID=A0AAD9P505_RIDPI|nr:hypothetical protein NP493_138g02010 [Ridgeia piscesae]